MFFYSLRVVEVLIGFGPVNFVCYLAGWFSEPLLSPKSTQIVSDRLLNKLNADRRKTL